MTTKIHTETLVVGGGPVGMFTALLLAKRGVEVEVIDSAARPTTHSYACGLHPRTLDLFAEAGIAEEVVDCGQRIEQLAFYEGHDRRKELRFDFPGSQHPFFVVMAQSQLEALLAEKLLEEASVDVKWMHRLASLQQTEDHFIARVDRLGETSTGYVVPHWETVVQNSLEYHASFVVGADGHESFVRRALGIHYDVVAPPELYVVYEFESAEPQPPEIRVVLDHSHKSVLWQLEEERCRWSFQWPRPDANSDFPHKDRNPCWLEAPHVAERTAEHLQQLVKARAPWFKGRMNKVDWAVDVQFERRIAESFWRGRCCLVGDAAHQTCPVGVQSTNVGFREGHSMAEAVELMLHDPCSSSLLQSHQQSFRAEWELLHGLNGILEHLSTNSSPALTNIRDLMASLPASGHEHTEMLKRLGLEWHADRR